MRPMIDWYEAKMMAKQIAGALKDELRRGRQMEAFHQWVADGCIGPAPAIPDGIKIIWAPSAGQTETVGPATTWHDDYDPYDPYTHELGHA